METKKPVNSLVNELLGEDIQPEHVKKKKEGKIYLHKHLFSPINM